MYILPNAQAFNDACVSQTRTLYLKCEVDNGGSTVTLTSDDIVRIKWDNVASTDRFRIGTACMDTFDMTYRANQSIPDLLGKAIIPYIGVEVGGSEEYVPLGVFYVVKSETDDDGNTVAITAYDSMQLFAKDADWSEIGVSFPINSFDLLEAITSAFGVSVVYNVEDIELLERTNLELYGQSDKLLVTSEIDANKRLVFDDPFSGTYRDYIGFIVGLVGANAHFNREGDLEIKRYAPTGFEIPRDAQFLQGAKVKYDGSVTYTSVVGGTAEVRVEPVGYSGNAVEFDNPYVTPTEVTRICDEIIGAGLTITPVSVKWRGNPCVDVCDIVGVEDKNGNMATAYVMERVVTVDGGMDEELSCYGDTEAVQSINIQPSTMRARNASNVVQNTKGTFQFIANTNAVGVRGRRSVVSLPDGRNKGFVIYDDDGKGLLQCTSEGLKISTDGGLTFGNAITKDGVTATNLEVHKNGVEVLETSYSETFQQSSLTMRDAQYGNLTARILSGRNVDSVAGMEGGYSSVYLYNGKTGGVGISLTTDYYDDAERASHSRLTINDPALPYGRINASAWTGSDEVSHAELGIRREDGNPVVAFIATDDTPSILASDSGGLHSLSLQQIAINGTNYWIFAGTT